MQGYTRDKSSGQLRYVILAKDDAGILCHDYRQPDEFEHTGTTTLKGWGDNDGTADVYEVDGCAWELVVPERFAKSFRRWVGVTEATE